MGHVRSDRLSKLTDADLGGLFAMKCDEISAGRKFDHAQDLFALKALMSEAAARLHPDYPTPTQADPKA